MRLYLYFHFMLGLATGVCLNGHVAMRKNFTYKGLDYILPARQTSCKCCATLCNAFNAKVAKIDYHLLSLDLFRDVTKTSTWIFPTSSNCVYVYGGTILYVGLENKSEFPCFCQRVVLNTTTPKILPHNKENTDNVTSGHNDTETDIIDVNGRQFLVNSANLSYDKSVKYCETLKAAMVSFTYPLLYMQLKTNLTISGQYWVGDKYDGRCLALNTTQTASLYTPNCMKKLYSICSRVSNVSEVLNNPAFLDLISNMTINVRKTKKMERKLTCAKDDRTSAKAVGASVGVAFVGLVSGLLFSGDLVSIFKWICGN